jgi:hypothetical protein
MHKVDRETEREGTADREEREEREWLTTHFP